jgi:hypothetical protein
MHFMLMREASSSSALSVLELLPVVTAFMTEASSSCSASSDAASSSSSWH